jgi:putative PIN family toxin of toxin-antitoxin system
MTVVLDANVWISAFLSSTGPPARIVAAVGNGTLVAVSSTHLWSELLGALTQPKLRRILQRKGAWETTQAALVVAQRLVLLVPAVSPQETWLAADPDDDWVIQCALTANADYIISGDRHLLSLGQVGRVRIISPAEFAAEVLDQR